MLDVFFITMGEPKSHDNWQRLSRYVPSARRVENIKGIYNVHATCAKLSKTDNFWVVDADAWVLDSFDFTWEPDPNLIVNSVRETDSVVIWPSRNPVNGLEYGYGAVKVFPKQPFIDGRSWSIDMTSSVAKNIISKETISCETRFNATPETAWIGAFRECTKLSSLSMIKARVRSTKVKEQEEFDTIMEYVSAQSSWTHEQKLNYRKTHNLLVSEKYKNEKSIFLHWGEIDLLNRRLLTWCSQGWDKKNGQATINGARAGAKYGLKNSDNVLALDKINDWDWLRKEYRKNVNV